MELLTCTNSAAITISKVSVTALLLDKSSNFNTIDKIPVISSNIHGKNVLKM